MMGRFKKNNQFLFSSFMLIFLIVLPILVEAECTCDEDDESRDRGKAMRYKIAALASILVASAIGVCIPLLGKVIPALSPEKDIFFIIKAFAAGVILATAFIHVLPDAFENLTSPCLKEHPWGDFPFTGFVAMCTAMGTLMIDTYATAYFQKHHSNEIHTHNGDVDKEAGHEGHVHLHTHATHGHSHGPVHSDDHSSQLLRHRVISQVFITSSYGQSLFSIHRFLIFKVFNCLIMVWG